MKLDYEGLADPTCVVFGYLFPRDQAALRSTSRTFVQRFNRAVWYGCGIPYAGCRKTVFKTLEEAEEATDCRWAPIGLLRNDQKQWHVNGFGTLVVDVSCSGVAAAGHRICRILCDPSEGNLMMFKSLIVLPSNKASSFDKLIVLEQNDRTKHLRIVTKHLDLRAFDQVKCLDRRSFTAPGQYSSLDVINQLPKLVMLGYGVGWDNTCLCTVELCNLENLEFIWHRVFYNMPGVREVTLQNLPRLKYIGDQFCHTCNRLTEFSAKNLPMLEQIGAKPLSVCYELRSVSFVDCPKLHTIGDEFLRESGFYDCVVDLSGLPALTKAPSQLLQSSYCSRLRFIAPPNMTELGTGFLQESHSLGEIQFENTQHITSFGDHWMQYCECLQSVPFESFPSLTSVGSGWLSQSRFVKRVDLSSLKNLESIGDDAFKDSSGLEECCLDGLSKLSSIGGGFLHGTPPCTLKVRGCTALIRIGVMADDKTRRRLKAIKGAKDLPPRVQALLEENIVGCSCCSAM